MSDQSETSSYLALTAADRLDAFFAQDRASPAEDYAYRLEDDAIRLLHEWEITAAAVLSAKAFRILVMCRGMWIDG